MKKSFSSLVACMLIALSVSMLLNAPASMAAFGTSPPWVKSDQLLPGSTFEQIIYLSRSETDEAMRITTKTSGDEDLLSWMTIVDRESMVMEKGQSIFPMRVVIKVPENAELRNYVGGIFIALAPLTEGSLSGGQVAISLGAHIAVEITVTDEEISDYRIKSASVESLEKEDPFAISMKVENTGNIDISNLEGQINIYDSANAEIIESLVFIPLESPVAFNETKEIIMVYEDSKLAPGQYWVEVTTTKDGEMIYQNRLSQEVRGGEPPIVILPEDVIAPPETVKRIRTIEEKNNIYLILGISGWIVGLLALSGIIALSFYEKKAKGKRKKARRTR